MHFILIILLCIGSAVAYGILHDQITARICVEYFTIGHPPVFDTDSPTLLGIGWGIIATWWVGFLLGVPLACAARLGHRPSFSAWWLFRPIMLLLGAMTVIAFVSGMVGYLLAAKGVVKLLEPLASRVPHEHHIGFLVDVFSHLASYGSGFIGGIFVIVWTWRRRGKLRALAEPEIPAAS